MRISKFYLAILTGLVCLLLLSAGKDSKAASFNLLKPVVILKAGANATELKITTPGSRKCKKAHRKKAGCMHIGRGDQAHINFKLIGSPNWTLTQLKICKGSDKTSLDCNLRIGDLGEFIATDASSSKTAALSKAGIIDLTQITSATARLAEFILIDNNNYAQDYFYQVQACDKMRTTRCIWSDPPIENKGRT